MERYRSFFCLLLCGVCFLSTGECRWKATDAEYLVKKLAVSGDEKEKVLQRIYDKEFIGEADEALNKLKIKRGFFFNVIVEGKTFLAPETFKDLKGYLVQIDREINYQKHKKDCVTFDVKTCLKYPYMARGKHAKVYDFLNDQDCVFKLTVPTLAALRCVIEDNENDAFWANQEIETLTVPERLHGQCSAGGLYRVFKRSSGITLTKALLAWDILEIKKSDDEKLKWNVTTHWPPSNSKDTALFMPVQSVILNLLDVIKSNKGHNVSLAPNNLLVVFEYTNAEEEDSLFVKSVDLVDTGVSVGSKLDANAEITDFDDYLKMAKHRLHKYLTDEIHRYGFERLKRAQGVRTKVFELDEAADRQ